MQILDISGHNCPVPLIKTKKKLSELTSGEQLQVITTDASFGLDVKVFVKQTGNTLLSYWQQGSQFTYILQKGQL